MATFTKTVMGERFGVTISEPSREPADLATDGLAELKERGDARNQQDREDRAERREKQRRQEAAEVLAREIHYDVTPHGNATYLLMQHGDRLLVVADEQQSRSDLYVLNDGGLWHRGDQVIREWLIERADNLRLEAVKEGMDAKGLAGLLRSIRPLLDPSSVEPIRKEAAASYSVMRRKFSGRFIDDDYDFGVTVCLDTDLDKDLRYIGCESGVIDLHTGKLLDPQDGRKALVTHKAPVKYVTGATHADVDRLFAHLPEGERNWWWSALGFALRGAPARRFYECSGPPNGGKDGLMYAITSTVGCYATVTQASLLENRRGGSNESETGLKPQVVSIVPPARIAFVNEVKPARLNHRVLKDYSGGGLVTWQPKNKDPRTDPVSATLVILCNTGSQAQIGGHDEGIQDRICALPYPAIPADKRIPDFNTVRVHRPEFRQALFARLVAAAAEQQQGKPPSAPPAVAQATAARIREDAGELGTFAVRIVRGGDTPLFTSEVWAAWCEHNDEEPDATTAGGIAKNKLTPQLRELVRGLPKATHVTIIPGKQGRGWRGWQLLDEAPPAQETPQWALDHVAVNGDRIAVTTCGPDRTDPGLLDMLNGRHVYLRDLSEADQADLAAGRLTLAEALDRYTEQNPAEAHQQRRLQFGGETE